MRLSHRLCVLLLVVGLVAVPASAEGFFRSAGLRFTLSWGGPILIGAEATTDLGFGLGRASFFLSPKGEGMFLIGVGIPLTEGEADTITYLEALTGFYYFDLSAFAPSLLVGLGISYESITLSPFLLGLAVDFVYPIALPVPLLSTFFGWSFE